jgi:catechol 2,3-dioxygenase-like lactoylglutathione lyase family enzyme
MTDVRSVDHVQLAVAIGGLREARHFYQDLLGLREVRDPALDRPGTLRFSLGGQRLDLSEGHYLGVAPHAHLALQVDGLADIVRRLKAERYPLDHAPLDDRDRLYVEDPFGNRLELIGPAATEKNRHASELRFSV